jgi:hypothetical protein
MLDPENLDKTLAGLGMIERLFEKAVADSLAFGEGWIRVKGDTVEHVPFEEVRRLQADGDKTDG